MLKPLTSTAIPVDDPIAAIELFMESGWTDGLPVVPPTPELVRRMVGDYEPQEFIGYVPPKYGGCTIEKLAINAVMAGCKPAYLPVIIAGVKAMLTEIFNLHGVQSNHPHEHTDLCRQRPHSPRPQHQQQSRMSG